MSEEVRYLFLTLIESGVGTGEIFACAQGFGCQDHAVTKHFFMQVMHTIITALRGSKR